MGFNKCKITSKGKLYMQQYYFSIISKINKLELKPEWLVSLVIFSIIGI